MGIEKFRDILLSKSICTTVKRLNNRLIITSHFPFNYMKIADAVPFVLALFIFTIISTKYEF